MLKELVWQFVISQEMSIKFQEKETMQFTKAREDNANKDFLGGRKRRWATKTTNLNTEGIMYLKKGLGRSRGWEYYKGYAGRI